MTCNLAGELNWHERAEAVGELLRRYRPDIVCVQELSASVQVYLDTTLTEYQRVTDDKHQSAEVNIYWNATQFDVIACGFEDIGALEANRHLCWARLQSPEETSLLVASAHLTYRGHPTELATGHSPRLTQTKNCIDVLTRLRLSGEPVVLAGDLNDPSHPIYLLTSVGFRDCFSLLGEIAPATVPVPGFYKEFRSPAASQTLDWLVVQGPLAARAAMVPKFTHRGVAPSDHWPVVAILTITTQQNKNDR